MKKIRLGNTFEIVWEIFLGKDKDKGKYDLTGKKLTIYLVSAFERIKISDFTTEFNVLRFTFEGKEQKHAGRYQLTFVENEGGDDTRTLNKCDAFEIVQNSCMETDDLSVLNLSSSFDALRIYPIIPQVGPNRNWWVDGVDTGKSSVGLTAYEFAKENGYEGTEDEYAAECLAVPVLNDESRTATAEAKEATKNATDAAENANNASEEASTSASQAAAAAASANNAAENADAAAEEAHTAAQNAEGATKRAEEAIEAFGPAIANKADKIKFEGKSYVETDGISTNDFYYSMPDSADGTEDDIIATKSNLKKINGQDLFGKGNIVIEGKNYDNEIAEQSAKLTELSAEIVIEKGDAENSAVLKGGDNQAISEGGVALGKNNIVGLKGWYYKAMSISDTGYVYLYLSSDQQLPSFVSSAKEVEQENDTICALKEGDICCIVNGNKFINVFEVKYNHIKQYGRVGFSYIGEGDNPIDGIITTEEINKGNLSLDDYCVYCLNKPDIGNVNISEYALSEGKLTKSLNSYTHAEGLRSAAYGKTSHVEGQDNIASGECSHAEGAYTKSTGDASHAEGFNTEASELSAHAEGYGTLASNGASHAEGSATKATGLHSHAEGDTTEASGEQSHAEGKSTKAEGLCSHAEGRNTTATGNYSHVEGGSTKAEGPYSHAEGSGTTAEGLCSHAEGGHTTAEGDYSHAEGYRTKATAIDSHAEGSDTTAEGLCSHAEGDTTKATGTCSHAEGKLTTAEGFCSHAEGLNTIATNPAEHASGQCNQSTNSTDSAKATCFSIGIGTSNTDRKNAVEVKANGDVYIIGVGGYDGTNSDSAQTLQEILANL